MKTTTFKLFIVTLVSEKGNFVREITVEADNITEAFEVASEYGKVGSISEDFRTHVKRITKTIIVEC